MNVKKLTEMIKILKEDLGEALMASDIWTVSDGRSIAAYNAQPKATALFNRITKYLNKALDESDYPPLEEYYTVSLADKVIALVLPLGDYQQGMLVDTKKIEMGLILNVTIPKLKETFKEALSK